MNTMIATYLVYLAISVAVTVWVANTLHKNGRIFLVDCFLGNEKMADSVNHLLVVGFYLINVGWVAMALRTSAILDTPRQAIELVSDKIGGILLVLGMMHFLNLYVFHRLRRRGQEYLEAPPVAPDVHLPPPLPRGL